MKKFLIVEDEFPIALDIQSRLQKMGYESVGIVNTFDDACSTIKSKNPELVLLDINLNEEKSGLDIAGWINENCQIPFLFVTAYSDDFTFKSALNYHPSGFINKPFTDKEIFHQIEIAILRHQVDKEKEQEWLEKLTAQITHLDEKPEFPKGWEDLSKREKEVIVLLSDGLSDQDLADKLFISASTVRTHLRRIYDKLLINSRLEAVALMNKFNII